MTTPATIRIAVGTSGQGTIDQHFGQAEIFAVYEVNGSGSRLSGNRTLADHAQGGEDRRATIVRMLADCHMLLVMRVGEAPKKLLAGAGIEATDAYAGQPVETALATAFTTRNRA